MMLADSLNPFINGDPDILEKTDLLPAGAKSRVGYKFACAYSSSPNITLFSNYVLQYYIPDYSYLYFDYDYFFSIFSCLF